MFCYFRSQHIAMFGLKPSIAHPSTFAVPRCSRSYHQNALWPPLVPYTFITHPCILLYFWIDLSVFLPQQSHGELEHFSYVQGLCLEPPSAEFLAKSTLVSAAAVLDEWRSGQCVVLAGFFSFLQVDSALVLDSLYLLGGELRFQSQDEKSSKKVFLLRVTLDAAPVFATGSIKDYMEGGQSFAAQSHVFWYCPVEAARLL
jgi:hypothetical protein